MGQHCGSACLPRVFLILFLSFRCRLFGRIHSCVTEAAAAVCGQRFHCVHAGVEVMFYLAVHGVGQERHRTLDPRLRLAMGGQCW